jgi:hypothetical protein
LDRAIKGAGTETNPSTSQFRDIAHDSITVKVAVRQGKQNVERGGGQRVELASWHNQSPLNDISINEHSLENPYYQVRAVAEKAGFLKEGLRYGFRAVKEGKA